MTRSEKEQFSAFMAAVFAPPDKTLLANLEREEPSLFQNGETSLNVLQKDYVRLFSNICGESFGGVHLQTLDRR
jgi:hypothetical protein